MGDEQKYSQPRYQLDLGSILAVFQAKLLGHEAIIDTLIDIITTHDFSKGNPTRDQLSVLIKQKLDEIAKQAEEMAQKNILLAKPKSNLILPK